MKSLQPLKERLKVSIRKEFLDIKKQAGAATLYVFSLGRVEDLEGQYFAAGSTIPYLKQQFEEDDTYYSTFWLASEMELSADYQDIYYEELSTYLEGASDEEYDQLRIEYDQLLIDSLVELKQEGVFDDEIPEFAVFVEYVDEGFDTVNSSYERILGSRFLDAFRLRYERQSNSLTAQLLSKYGGVEGAY